MSQPSREDAIETEKERIITNLTNDQEEVLKNIHAESYSGTDYEMSDNYEKWLMDLTLMDLEAYLE
jgi:hypothetical protein